MFDECEDLESLNVSNWNFSGIDPYNSFSHFFPGDSEKKLNNITYNNIICGTMFPEAFVEDLTIYCNLNRKLDLSSWNVNNVTNMDGCLNALNCTELDLSNWDVSNVTSMNDLFAYGDLEKIYVSDIFEEKFNEISNYNEEGKTDWMSKFIKE